MNQPDIILHKLLDAIRAAPPLEVRLAPSDAALGVVTGYASTFGPPADAYGDIIAPNAFAKSLAAHKAAGTVPAMLWSHSADDPIGVWNEVREDARGLLVRGEVNQDTQRGREALALAKQGASTGLSIGFRIPLGGRSFNSDGTATVKEVELWEVSLTPLPANRNARLTRIKSLASARELEDILRDAGLAKAAAKAVVAGGWKALSTGDQSEMEQLQNRLASAATELRSMRGK